MEDMVLTDSNPALAEFKRRDAAIAELSARCMPLKIAGLNDKAGYLAVHKARMEVKGHRLNIEKTRKDLKADVLAYGKAVDGEAARLTGLIQPIEDHLAREEDAIDAEKESIKQAAEAARQAIINGRIAEFNKLHLPAPADVAYMTQAGFDAALHTARLTALERDRLAKIEQDRLDAEAEARRLEREELDRLRAEQAETQRKQQAEAARLRAEQVRMEQEHAAHVRAHELEVARQEAAARAVAETEARLKRESEARQRAFEEAEKTKFQKAQEDEIARQKALAEMPWKQKILAVASTLDAIVVPEGHAVMVKVYAVIQAASKSIRKLANGPLE